MMGNLVMEWFNSNSCADDGALTNYALEMRPTRTDYALAMLRCKLFRNEPDSRFA